jgi:hypothetical protein
MEGRRGQKRVLSHRGTAAAPTRVETETKAAKVENAMAEIFMTGYNYKKMMDGRRGEGRLRRTELWMGNKRS